MYCPFSKYATIFGEVGKGAHAYRMCDVAMIDYVMTIMVSLLTTCLTKIPIVITTIFWLMMGVIMHVIFGVPTSTVKWLGLTC